MKRYRCHLRPESGNQLVRIRHWAGFACGILAGLSGLVAGVEARNVSSDGVLRVMTWNIHHGAGVDGRLDLDRIAGVIRGARVDLVALQEVDRGVARTDRRDLPGELAALTGMTAVFSNNFSFQGGEYGNAILSQLPVLAWTNRHYAMLRGGEQRGLLEAVVEWRGCRLRFQSTHLDYRPDDTERLAHVGEIRALAAVEGKEPFLIAGDFNALPDSRTVVALRTFLSDAWVEAGDGPGATFSSSAPVRRIDYCFYKAGRGIRPESARVLVGTEASDHLPVVFQFRATGASESE